MAEKKIFRIGKTARDHKSGAWARCIRNKQERADWQKDTSSSKEFRDIAHTCNGKRNRYAHVKVI